jgi:hypothetical protein
MIVLFGETAVTKKSAGLLARAAIWAMCMLQLCVKLIGITD